MTHCASAFLTHSDKTTCLPNLVIARHTALDIYRIKEIDTEYKLELVLSRRLFGVIESLSVLKKPRQTRAADGRDAILLTFRDAKLSVVRWNGDIWDIESSSLHYFESDVSLKTGRVCFPSPPFTAVDPSGRCAAVIMFRHQMAILPATEALEEDVLGLYEEDEGDENEEKASDKVSMAAVGNSYVDNLSTVGVRDIRDAVFLSGTSEPTLLCLYESEPSWAGNVREKKDTCSLAALSINLSEKRHPKVWEALELPFDAYKLVATPDGGALVFTGTSVLYYNQNQKCGVILHSQGVPCKEDLPPLVFDPSLESPAESAKKYAEKHGTVLSPNIAPSVTSFTDTQYSEWDIDCSCSHTAWLDENLAVISFRQGPIVTLEITKQSGGLRKMILKRAASGPQPTCMTCLGSELIFIGSRGGDSLLLSCVAETTDANGGQKRKKQKIDVKKLADDNDIFEEYMEEDLLSLYAASEDSHSPSEIRMHVCDSITSLGALRKIIQLSAENDTDPSKFLACCGTAENGALAILQDGLSPDVIASIPLPGLKQVWSIGKSKEHESWNAFLVLGFCDHTKILSASQGLKELTNELEFLTDVETVAAGTFSNGVEFQVHPQGLRILEDGKMQQDLNLDQLKIDGIQENSKIYRAAACDQHMSLILTDGTGHLFTLRDTALTFLCSIPSSFQGKKTKIVSFCFYNDASKWLSSSLGKKDGNYIITCYENGDMMIWDILNLGKGSKDPIWWSNALSSGVDVVQPVIGDVTSFGIDDSEAKKIVDISVKHFPCTSNPILIALTDASLYCYTMFISHAKMDKRHLRLKRIRMRLASRSIDSDLSQIHVFDRIGEHLPYSGFFISGNVPIWLIVSRGQLYAHKGTSTQNERFLGFTEFNNENCPSGFLACKQNGLMIANFPPRQRLDAPWPRRKLGIKSVPIDCSYYPEAKLISLIASIPAPHVQYLPEDGESEPQAAYSYSLAGVEGVKTNHSERHEIRLVNPNTWRVPWSYQLLPGEKGVCIQALHLRDQTTEATIPLIAIGTAFSAGEDYPCSGRVILIEVTKDGSSSWNGRMVFAREFKGPVTNISSVEGYLLLSTGNRIETCILKSQKPDTDDLQSFSLQRSAFYEGPSMVTSLNVVKNFILIGDSQHSVHFLRYKDQGKQIMLLSKDFGQACTRACQFIIAGSSLHIVMADGEGNLWSFTYSPNDSKSWKGQKLEKWGAIHVGKGISCMLRTAMSHHLFDASPQGNKYLSDDMSKPKQGVFCGTDMGGIHYIVPLTVAEAASISSWAKMASNALIPSIPHCAGLNPSAFRRRYQKSLVSLHGAMPYDPPPSLFEQGMIDGDLLNTFLQQPIGLQSRVAFQLGITKERLIGICDMINDIRPC